MWRQVIELSIVMLERGILNTLTNVSRVLAYNTDSITIYKPSKKAVKEAERITKRKEDFKMMGLFMLEKFIKVKGKTFDEINCIDKPYVLETPPRNIIRRQANEIDTFVQRININESCLITADIGGAGKTWLMTQLFDIQNDKHLFLLPKHEAVANIKRTVVAQGKNISECLNRIRVIAEFFNGLTSDCDQQRKLSKYSVIFLDEIFQFNIKDLKQLYYAAKKYGIILIAAGAFDQADSPNNNYNLKDNSFFYDYLFGGNIVKLEYIENSGRFKDTLMPTILNEVINNGQIPTSISSQQADINHNFHLTVTRNKRDKIAKICSSRYCASLSDEQKVKYIDMNYGIGLELRCNNNFEMKIDDDLDTVKVKNKRI